MGSRNRNVSGLILKVVEKPVGDIFKVHFWLLLNLIYIGGGGGGGGGVASLISTIHNIRGIQAFELYPPYFKTYLRTVFQLFFDGRGDVFPSQHRIQRHVSPYACLNSVFD